jgi:hypothetical protein
LNSQLSYIKEMLDCCAYSSAQHSNFQIRETSLDAALKTLNFKIDQQDVDGWLMFTPDTGRGKAGCMSNLLATGHGHHHHSACDSVVILTRQSCWHVIYLELKSNRPSVKDYVKQFKSTRQFVRYVFGLCQDLANIETGELIERFVVFCTKPSINIKPTRLHSKLGVNPDNPRLRTVANGASLYLK